MGELNSRITHLEQNSHKLEEENHQLELEKLENQHEFELLNSEVDDFTKGIEYLQSQNMQLENQVKIKELRVQELQYSLQDATANSANTQQNLAKNESEDKPDKTDPFMSDVNVVQTSINKLTVKMYEFLKRRDENQQVSESETTIVHVYKGKIPPFIFRTLRHHSKL